MTINKMMKRSLIIILTVLILTSVLLVSFAGCQNVQTDFDIKTSSGEYGDKTFEYMTALANEYPNRTMATEGEKRAAEYISSLMTGWGYTSDKETDGIKGLQQLKLGFTRYDGSSVKDGLAYNVVFDKKAAESKGKILLMCQYDNLYSEQGSDGEWGADGSYESGASVAVMLTLAELLKDSALDYDLTFIFFTGGSYSWMGAKYYADNLKRADIDNIKLAINFSMLAGGENLYLYTGENATSYGNYMAKASTGLTKSPANKNIAYFTLENDAIFNYSHIGMLGNQYYLMNKGIPVANYLSLNWSKNDNPMLTEIDGKSNVYHTKDDTFANMKERVGESKIKSMTNNVVNSVMVVLDKENSKVMTDALALADKESISATSQSTKTASLLNIILKILVIAAIFGGSVAVKHYIQKNREKYMVKAADEEQTKEPEPFGDDFVQTKNTDGEDNRSSIDHTDNKDDDPFV